MATHSSRHFANQDVHGYQSIITESDPHLDYLAFDKLQLKADEAYTGQTGQYETVLVILSGQIDVSSANKHWKALGKRDNVFAGKATAVYIPCREEYEVSAVTDADVAVCKALADETFTPFVVQPDDVIVNHRGKENWQREVHDIIPDKDSIPVQRIIVGETFNKAGQWSSYPPHKHDQDNLPDEVMLEEIYHYQLKPQQGFGVQLHYTADKTINDAYIVRHGDSFAIDKGYHPVSAAGGYELYYLWFLAGPSKKRVLIPKDESEHVWLK